jgi:hypothetical protein
VCFGGVPGAQGIVGPPQRSVLRVKLAGWAEPPDCAMPCVGAEPTV